MEKSPTNDHNNQLQTIDLTRDPDFTNFSAKGTGFFDSSCHDSDHLIINSYKSFSSTDTSTEKFPTNDHNNQLQTIDLTLDPDFTHFSSDEESDEEQDYIEPRLYEAQNGRVYNEQSYPEWVESLNQKRRLYEAQNWRFYNEQRYPEWVEFLNQKWELYDEQDDSFKESLRTNQTAYRHFQS